MPLLPVARDLDWQEVDSLRNIGNLHFVYICMYVYYIYKLHTYPKLVQRKKPPDQFKQLRFFWTPKGPTYIAVLYITTIWSQEHITDRIYGRNCEVLGLVI